MKGKKMAGCHLRSSYRDNAKPEEERAVARTRCGLITGFGIAGVALALIGGTVFGRRFESRHPTAPPPCRNHAIVVGSEATYCDPEQDAQLVNGQVLVCTCRRK